MDRSQIQRSQYRYDTNGVHRTIHPVLSRSENYQNFPGTHTGSERKTKFAIFSSSLIWIKVLHNTFQNSIRKSISDAKFFENHWLMGDNKKIENLLRTYQATVLITTPWDKIDDTTQKVSISSTASSTTYHSIHCTTLHIVLLKYIRINCMLIAAAFKLQSSLPIWSYSQIFRNPNTNYASR